MYVKPRIDISIDSEAYEHIINNVKLKAPLEIGIEIAVYMLLFGLIEKSEVEVVDVNSMWRQYAKIYSNSEEKETKFGAVPDLVIADKDFDYNDKSIENHAYGFIEVKSLAINDIKYTDEIISHMANTNHFIWTNGLIWHYYNKSHQDKNWDIDVKLRNTNNNRIFIDERKFGELLYHLAKIDWRQ